MPTSDPVPQPAHLRVAIPQSRVPSWATVSLLPADKSFPQREEKLTDVHSQPSGPPMRVSTSVCHCPHLSRVASHRVLGQTTSGCGEKHAGPRGNHRDPGLTNNSSHKNLSHNLRAYRGPGPIHTSPLIPSMTLQGVYIRPILQSGKPRPQRD